MSWAFNEQPEHKIANNMILSFRMEFVIAWCGVDYVYVEYEYFGRTAILSSEKDYIDRSMFRA